MCADDLVSILPFLFVKARIDRLLAHFKFVSAFHISDEDGGQIEVYFTNFRIIVERITTFIIPDHELPTSMRTFTEVDQLALTPMPPPSVLASSSARYKDEEESKQEVLVRHEPQDSVSTDQKFSISVDEIIDLMSRPVKHSNSERTLNRQSVHIKACDLQLDKHKSNESFEDDNKHSRMDYMLKHLDSYQHETHINKSWIKK